jgi:hypothetical protein
MKKLLIAIFSLWVLGACSDLTDLNDNPKRTDKVPAYSLLASAEKTFADNLTSPSVNTNIFRMLAQQWTETTYTDEANYDLTTRNIPQNWWHSFYRDVIKDLREAKRISSEDKDISSEEMTNQFATAEILEVYAWALLVDTFGDIPYKEAMNVSGTDDDNLLPAYDDAAEIYNDLIARLETAIGQLNPAAGSWGENDLIYGGDVEKWMKFGNSLLLRMGMMLADVDIEKARATVQNAIAGGVFQSNDDNAMFFYKSAPPNTNPIWVNLVQSGRKDFVAANTLVDTMLTLGDPRISKYFTEDATGTADPEVESYSGGIYGASNNYATYSKPADLVDNADFPGDILDYAEVEFLLAEAVERGFNAGLMGTAEDHYNAAITASMEFWGVEQADIDAYLAQPEVAYSTAGVDYRAKIGFQKWLALYNRGFEAWTEWRRLDAPELIAPEDAVSDVPLRYTYPVSEQNLNTINYDVVVAKIGADDVATTIFWDIL